MKNKQVYLCQIMEQYAADDVMVAFSGGVDSALLLKLACEAAGKTGKKVYAVTVHTMLHPAEELEAAEKTAKEMGAIHHVLRIDELRDAQIAENPQNRCYLCKRHLFCEIRELAEKKGISVIIEGTNEDDLHVYRPGIRAVRELKIKSPLADANMTKDEVRALAREYGLNISSKPSMPCLATRFPYGTKLSYEKLKQVNQGEMFLRKLGYRNVRIRVYGDLIRVEIDNDEMQRFVNEKDNIISHLKGLGYSYITMDLEGFRSGSMDLQIKKYKEGRK